ncbi:MAG: efflux RND transporter periplasmic adaptor subunit [Phycisphaerae bacterium]
MTTELHKLRIDKSHKVHRRATPWLWISLILLLAAAGYFAYQYKATAAAIPVQTLHILPVESSAASPAHDLVVLQATGYIMAAHKVELASKVVGRVAWVGVEMGDKVKSGQILVRLEDDEYLARVAQEKGQLDAAKAKLAELEAGNRPQEIAAAQARYEHAQADADYAARNYQRVFDIRSSRTPSELDDAEANMKTKKADAEEARQQYNLMKAGSRQEAIDAQKATVAELQGALALAQVDLDNTIIKAPHDATILERNVEVGEFVTTGFVGDRGAKGYVLSIADLSDLLVQLDISQSDFAKVALHQPCSIVTDAYPDRKYPGTVQLISPVANRQKATIEVRVKITAPDDLLKPDMNATVSFLATPNSKSAASQSADTSPTPTFRIPSTAIRNNTIFILENHKARQIPITPGLTTADNQTEITKGLLGGEDLILNPPESLKDNDPVTAK